MFPRQASGAGGGLGWGTGSHPTQREPLGSALLVAIQCKILGVSGKGFLLLKKHCDHPCSRQALRARPGRALLWASLPRTNGHLLVYSGPVPPLNSSFQKQELLCICSLPYPTPKLCWLMSALDKCLLNECVSTGAGVRRPRRRADPAA